MLAGLHAFFISISSVPIFELKIFSIVSFMLLAMRFYRLPFFSNVSKYYILGLCIFVFLAFFYTQQIEKLVVLLYVIFAFVFVFTPYHMFTKKHWIIVSWVHICFFLISVTSIAVYGEDILPRIIYGESRHAVAQGGSINFRASGIYSEPSTYGGHMLFIYMLLKLKGMTNHRLTNQMVILSILATVSFSSIILLLILSIEIFKNKKTLRTFIAYLFIFAFMSIVLIPFFQNKINVYSSLGLENVERFKAILYLYDYPNIWVAGLPSEMLSKFVVYDLGWFFSSFIIFGILGVPIALVPFILLLTSPSYFLLFFTKLSFTNPVCWLTIGQALRNRKCEKIG